MRFEDLKSLQALPLVDKIDRAVEWIGKGFDVSIHNQAIAFSGGKDSTVLAWLILKYFTDKKPYCIFGNTGVEYPESIWFARKFGKEYFGDRFIEALPEKLEEDELKYQAQRETLEWLEREGRIGEVLKDDGKLKTTKTLERAATPEMWEDFRKRGLVWKKGYRKTYWYCIDQYGYPILGKSKSKLDAKRINIDCFLKYSQTISESEELIEYYKVLKQVKISQHCCKLLKKEPSEREQAAHDVDVIFKGLMAAESRNRMTSFCTRGELFHGAHRDHLPPEDPFWHCNPLGIWTDDDIWEFIHSYDVPYSDLYNVTWRDDDGKERKIVRNGCFGCATAMAFEDNQMAILRRTHPRIWEKVMKAGMAEQLQKLRIVRNMGQASLLDVYPVEDLIEYHPCVFDSINELVVGGMPVDYDAEETL